jgi:hypothetical protein
MSNQRQNNNKAQDELSIPYQHFCEADEELSEVPMDLP